jgi:hypothetical protein
MKLEEGCWLLLRRFGQAVTQHPPANRAGPGRPPRTTPSMRNGDRGSPRDGSASGSSRGARQISGEKQPDWARKAH